MTAAAPKIEVREWKYASPSQISQFRRCESAWHWDKLGGHREPEAPHQKLGTETHAELEAYLINGTVPKSKIALAGINRLPDPDTVKPEHVEFGFCLVIYGAPVPIVGFIDLREPPHRISDHKTTSDLRYMKTPEELRGDPQGVIYGVVGAEPEVIGPAEEFRRGDKVEKVFPVVPQFVPVTFRHIYYRTRGAPLSDESEYTFDAETLRTQLAGVVQTLHEMHAASQKPIEEVGFNTGACKAYGKFCFHAARCAALGRPVYGPLTSLFGGNKTSGPAATGSLFAGIGAGKKDGSMGLADFLKNKNTGAAETKAANDDKETATRDLDALARKAFENLPRDAAGILLAWPVMEGGGTPVLGTAKATDPGGAYLVESECCIAHTGLMHKGKLNLTPVGSRVRDMVIATIPANDDQELEEPAAPAEDKPKSGLLGKLAAKKNEQPKPPTQVDRVYAMLRALDHASAQGASDEIQASINNIRDLFAEDSDGSIGDNERGRISAKIAEAEASLAQPAEFDPEKVPVVEVNLDDYEEAEPFPIVESEIIGKAEIDGGTFWTTAEGAFYVENGKEEPAGFFRLLKGPTEGAGSAINPTDGVPLEHEPEAPKPRGRPAKGPFLPDGRNVKELGKDDLVTAWTELSAPLAESATPEAFKAAYKAFSVMPDKRRAKPDYLADLEVLIALHKAADALGETASTEAVISAIQREIGRDPEGQATNATETPASDAQEPTAAPETTADTAPAEAQAASEPPKPQEAAPLSKVTVEIPERRLEKVGAAIDAVLVRESLPAGLDTVFNMADSFVDQATGGNVEDAAEVWAAHDYLVARRRALAPVTVFVNCRPRTGEVGNLDDILRPLQDAVAENAGLPYYDLIDFAKGPKQVAALLAMRIRDRQIELPPVIVADRRSPCVNSALEALARLPGIEFVDVLG